MNTMFDVKIDTSEIHLIFELIQATVFDIYFESLSNNLLTCGIDMVFGWWSRFEPTWEKKKCIIYKLFPIYLGKWFRSNRI